MINLIIFICYILNPSTSIYIWSKLKLFYPLKKNNILFLQSSSNILPNELTKCEQQTWRWWHTTNCLQSATRTSLRERLGGRPRTHMEQNWMLVLESVCTTADRASIDYSCCLLNNRENKAQLRTYMKQQNSLNRAVSRLHSCYVRGTLWFIPNRSWKVQWQLANGWSDGVHGGASAFRWSHT
jgi:hypothetical protein